MRRVDDAGAFRGHRRRDGGSWATVLHLADAFIDETLMRARHFKGELLLAALQLVLLMPKALVAPRPQRLLAALQLALAGGAAQPALASLGLSALSRLHGSWGELVRPALPVLLPHLSTLLEQGQQRSDADADSAGISVDAATGEGASLHSRARQRTRGAGASAGAGAGAGATEEEDDLVLDDDDTGAEASLDAEGEALNASLAESLRRPLKHSTQKHLVEAAACVAISAGSSAGAAVAIEVGGSDRGEGFGRPSSSSLYSSLLVATISMATRDGGSDGAGTDAEDGLQNASEAGGADGPGAGDAGGSGFSTGGLDLLYLSDQDVSAAGLRTRVVLLLAHLGADARHVLGSARDHLSREVEWGAIVSSASGPPSPPPNAPSLSPSAVAGAGTNGIVAGSRLALRLCFGAGTSAGALAGASGVGAAASAAEAFAADGAAPPVSLELPLDGMLPRIAQLALSAGVRRVKVAACEMLHAALSVIVGKAMTDGGTDPGHARVATSGRTLKDTSATQSGALSIFQHLLPTCLRLAVDSEPVTQQLFAPLSLQIVRLFSARDEMPEAAAVIVAVTEAMASADSSLRDFAAQAFAEFVKWSIKQ
jgi:hypothetical protein